MDVHGSAIPRHGFLDVASGDRHAAWCVIELAPDRGMLWARGIGCQLTQSQAHTQVREADAGPCKAVACGSPHVLTLSVGLHAPSAGPRVSRLAGWLTDYLMGLRARGQLSLGELQPEAAVPLGWVARLPRPLARYFEGFEVVWSEDFEDFPEMDQRRRDAADMMEQVQPMSVAGLLRTTRSWRPFLDWVASRVASDRVDVLRRSLLGVRQWNEEERPPASVAPSRSGLATCTMDPDRELMREVGCRVLFRTVWCGGPYRLGAGFPAIALLVTENRSVMPVPYWMYASEDETGALLELLRVDRRDPVFRAMARNGAVSLATFPIQELTRLGATLWRWAASGPGPAPPRPIVGDLVDALHSKVTRLRSALVAALDPDALEVSPSLQGYNYLVAAGDETLQHRRRQAHRVAPLLLPRLVTERLPKVAAAIDSASPLWPAVAEDCGVPLWCARRLRGLALNRDAVPWAARSDPGRVLKLIWLLGPEAPINGDFLDHLPDLVHLLDPAHPDSVLVRILAPMLARDAARQGWGVAAQVAASTLVGGITVDVAEPLQLLVQRVDHLGPPEPRAVEIEDVVKRLLQRRSLTDLLRLMGVLSDGQTHRSSMVGSDNGDRPLVSRLFTPATFGDPPYEARHLVTASELQTEGAEMNHCAGSLVGQVANHSCVVVAFKATSGSRCTVEYRPGLDKTWWVYQARRPGNARVAEDDPVQDAIRSVGERLDMLAGSEGASKIRLYLEAASRLPALRRRIRARGPMPDVDDGWSDQVLASLVAGPASLSLAERIRHAWIDCDQSNELTCWRSCKRSGMKQCGIEER